MSDIQEQIEFNEIWWNDVQEFEPIAQDEIDEVKSLIASLKIAVKALEEASQCGVTGEDARDMHDIIKTALMSINRLSGGNET